MIPIRLVLVRNRYFTLERAQYFTLLRFGLGAVTRFSVDRFKQ